MLRRCLLLLSLLAFAHLFSFMPSPEGKRVFSKNERRHIHVPTLGLFDNGGYFTLSTANLQRDHWRFPVYRGVVFQPDFAHESSVWYIASDHKKAPVRAAMDGIVRLSGKTSLGHTVVVRHSNGLETLYAHNAENEVKVGEAVRGGQTIARAGASHGMVYTYFSVLMDGVQMNPDLLASRNGTLKDFFFMCRKDGNGVKVVPIQTGGMEERLPQVLPEPEEQILVDLNLPLTSLEKTQVGVATPGLFDHCNSFTLDLNRMGRWSYPLPGARVISPYGGSRKNHTGTDLKTCPKDKIRAVFDGVVRFSGVYSAYGNIVVIRHANGLETCYSHNVKNFVKPGDRVKAGEVIALVGRTGRASTEHCHFEVRANGVPFNSDFIFNHATHQLRSGLLTIIRKGDGSISVKAH